MNEEIKPDTIKRSESTGGVPLPATPHLDDPSLPPQLPPERHDLRVLRSIRRIIRAAELYSSKLSGLYGVTVPQLVCLIKVGEKGPLTITDLSREVFLSSSTLVGIIDRLEARGFVERKRSTQDRRQVLVYPTMAGQDLVLRSPSPLQESLARSIERLPETERSLLAESLEKIVDLMEIEAVDASPIVESEPALESGDPNLLRFPLEEF